MSHPYPYPCPCFLGDRSWLLIEDFNVIKSPYGKNQQEKAKIISKKSQAFISKKLDRVLDNTAWFENNNQAKWNS